MPVCWRLADYKDAINGSTSAVCSCGLRVYTLYISKSIQYQSSAIMECWWKYSNILQPIIHCLNIKNWICISFVKRDVVFVEFHLYHIWPWAVILIQSNLHCWHSYTCQGLIESQNTVPGETPIVDTRLNKVFVARNAHYSCEGHLTPYVMRQVCISNHHALPCTQKWYFKVHLTNFCRSLHTEETSQNSCARCLFCIYEQ